ncbi:MAG: hypothetical protein ACOX4W_04795 [Bacilli bacterium]|jgi:hypothetical protein
MRRRFVLLFLMLIVSLLVATSAAYAWISLSKRASYQSSLIQASTSGKLRIYANTADSETYPRIFENYRREIFFDDEFDPFYSTSVIDHLMGDQSGNGLSFYAINEASPTNYKKVNGYGDALVISFWFSAYNMDEDEPEDTDKIVYLTGDANLTADQEISRATRVAFIKDNKLIGIWAPNAISDELTFVTSADFDNPIGGATSGRIKENPEGENEVLLIKAGYAAMATPLFLIDASKFDEEGKDVVTLVVWFEGTDENCVDAYLGQNVEINLVFAVRNASEEELG